MFKAVKEVLLKFCFVQFMTVKIVMAVLAKTMLILLIEHITVRLVQFHGQVMVLHT